MRLAAVSSVVRSTRSCSALTRSSFTARPVHQLAPSQQPVASSRRSLSRASRLTPLALFSTMGSKSIYDFTVKGIDGEDVNLAKYKGKVLLIVNVASQCGFTPQYKELAAVYDKYKSQGFEVLAFPCNQFGSQEPGSNAEIKQFAEARGAKFPLFSKVDVNGSNAEPLYSFLKEKQGGLLVSALKWNFSKFLVSKDGSVVKRYGSTTTPTQIAADIEPLL